MRSSLATGIITPVTALLLAGASLAPLTEAQAASTYQLDYTTADYSNVGPDGGTIYVSMVLASGSALPGLGSSFQVGFTLSAITSSNTTFVWDANNPGIRGLSYGYPTQNLYDNIPDENRNTLEQTIDGIWYYTNLQEWSELAYAAGMFVYTNSFTITSSFLPVVPDGYFLADQTINYGTEQNARYDDDLGILYSGMMSYTHNPITAFGEVSLYEWFTFNGDWHEGGYIPGPDPHPYGPIFMIDASVTYEAVPEPSTMALLAVAGGAAIMRLRRRRA